MSQSVLIDRAICLPAPEIAALMEGRAIATITPVFLRPGQQFALYPTDFKQILPLEQFYRGNFVSVARNSLAKLTDETVTVEVWVKCEMCQAIALGAGATAPIAPTNELEILSRLTVWTELALEKIIAEKGHFFLTYLRVYYLPEIVKMLSGETRNFVSLPQSVQVTKIKPILSDKLFTKRYQQLQNRQLPLHPELEELLAKIAQLNHLSTSQLANQISHFLGWKSQIKAKKDRLLDPELAWIKNIAIFGNRSDEKEEKKSNYQAGTDFEQVVHQALQFLGFGVDPDAKGGAGGMDLYCTTPYPLVGECKAGKSIPDSTAEQLYRIGIRHLGKEVYESAAKLIIGSGKPTKYLQESAQKAVISIIKPMTLQKLVELEAKFPGSVNLMELKPYLEAGQIDSRIDEYIQKVLTDIKLRSQIVQLVKNINDDLVNVSMIYAIYNYSNPPIRLNQEELQEILIELSSPLAGYLGRKKDSNGSRFYFLRDLHVD
ncbi:MAG: DUF1802 family protein [Oscillatoria sp. PMC 1076.18]|nr:DUF1802 family protein [Oscillatoria sp. PMC 1076.18]